MARTFNGTNQNLSNAAFDDFQFVSKASLAGWIRRASAGNFLFFGALPRSDRAFAVQASTNGELLIPCSNGDFTQWGNAGTLNDDDWHHILADFDGTQTGNANRLKVWIDAAAATLSFGGSGIDTQISASSGGTFEIGSRVADVFNDSIWGNGALGLIGAWAGHNLGAGAAADLYSGATHPGSYATGLVGYWKLDETTGDAADSSGNGYTMTALNNPGFEADPVGGGGGGAPVLVPYRRPIVTPPPGYWARFHRGV